MEASEAKKVVNIALQCFRDPAYGNKNAYAQFTFTKNHIDLDAEQLRNLLRSSFDFDLK